jgi:hypothetical protein
VIEMKKAVHVANVRHAMVAIKPSIIYAGEAYGWPCALDAVSTILTPLLIAAVAGDEPCSACMRTYEKAERLKHVPLLLASEAAPEPQGHA